MPADTAPDQTEIAVPLADGATLEATLVVPAGEGPHPAVIVLHEMFGLTDDIRGVAARFAQHGYLALAPNLFSHGNTYACLSRVLTDLFLRGARGRTIDDVLAARRSLAHRNDVDPDRIAVVGFCMGGAFALVAAVQGDMAAAAVNYGAVPKARSELDGVCPVVASFGAKDRIFGPQAARLEAHLTALGVPHDVKLYEGVGHSFINKPGGSAAWMARLPSPMRVAYSEQEAEDAWARMLTFFAEHV